MKRRDKNFVRLVALSLAVFVLSSCGGCNFAELFNIVLPEETEESGTPISPDGSYTNSEAQSGLVDDSTDDPTEEPTEEVIVQYNASMEEEIRQAYLNEYKPIISEGTLQVQFLGQIGNTYCVHVIDTSVHGHTGAYDIAGYEFRYLSGRKINVYHEGNLYLLEEAYEQGIVTKEDIAVFNAKFREINASSYKYIYPESNIREDNIDRMDMGRIHIKIQPNYNSKEYTKDDFADVRCVSLQDWGVNGESNEIHKFYTIYLPEDIDTPEEMLEIVRQLEKRDDIYSASIYFNGTLDSMPEDNEYMVEDYWAINKINLPGAWEFETGDSTILVGVIDSGIDGTHPDLQNRVSTTLSKSFTSYDSSTNGLQDQRGHGTMVAGIIGAQANNDIGVTGVCWDMQLVSLKANVSATSTDLNVQSVILAIYEAENQGIPIINLSGSFSEYYEDLRSAILAYSGIIVCSAGNWGVNLDATGGSILFYYPACFEGCDNLLVVGSGTQNDEIETGTNYGVSSVDLFAPGVNILTTYPTAICQGGNCGGNHPTYSNGYHYFQHTSAATPFVAGVAALMLAQEPTLDPISVKIRIMTYVDIVSNFEGKCTTSGRLNAFRAVHGACSYKHSYEVYTKSFHKAYCACGDFLYERHKGSPSCTKCGYSG